MKERLKGFASQLYLCTDEHSLPVHTQPKWRLAADVKLWMALPHTSVPEHMLPDTMTRPIRLDDKAFWSQERIRWTMANTTVSKSGPCKAPPQEVGCAPASRWSLARAARVAVAPYMLC